MKKSISLAVLVALVCLPALTACKSNTRRSGCTTCAPPQVTADLGGMTPVPGSDLAPDFSEPELLAPGPSTYEPQPTTAEVDGLRSDLNDATTRAATAENRANAIADENAALRRDLKRVVTELDMAPPAGPVASVPSAPVANTGAASDLVAHLRGMAGVEVSQRGASSVVVLVTDAFKSGSDQLKNDMRLQNALRDTAAAVSQHPGAQVQVVGHTDTQPIKISGWKSNRELSMARAKTVADLLVQNGVDTQMVRVDGQGELRPLIAPERNASDRATNRRVEILINL